VQDKPLCIVLCSEDLDGITEHLQPSRASNSRMRSRRRAVAASR